MAETQNPTYENALPRWAPAGVALLSLPAFLLGLTVPFFGPDEPRYAEVGREMWQSGDLITPTLGGYHWFEKPPLLYWLEALFYSIFGVNEFAARFGSALFGLATVLCLWLLVRVALDKSERPIANWVTVIAVSTLGLITFSHAASTDIVVTLPLTVAMSAFFVYDRRAASDEKGWRLYGPLLLMYVAAGLALLAKGLVGVIFPPAIILLYHVFCRRIPPRRLIVSVLWGIPLTLAVAAIWYVPMYLRYGNEFVNEFIIRQHFERFTTNVFQHPQPFYFYLYVLPLMTLPWLPCFFAGLWKAVQQVPKPAKASSYSALLLFSLAWLVVPVVFFSASTSKLPGYILPSLMPAIMLSAIAVRSLARKQQSWAWISVSVAAATLLVVSILLVTIVPRRAAGQSVKPLIDAADRRDFASARLMMMHSYNYSAEFYAAGRIDRDSDGRQARLFGPREVGNEMRRLGDRNILVIVPKEYAHQLFEEADLKSELLAENEEDAIVAVSLR